MKEESKQKEDPMTNEPNDASDQSSGERRHHDETAKETDEQEAPSDANPTQSNIVGEKISIGTKPTDETTMEMKDHHHHGETAKRIIKILEEMYK